MKKLIFISLLFSILSLSVSAQKPTKAEKAAQLEQEFQQTRQLIESNHFQFELNRVYPQGGQDLSRFNPRGKFVITDSVAKGTLPFFGRAYSLPYGEGGGIEFDGVMKDQSLKIEHKKKRKILIYRFSITAKKRYIPDFHGNFRRWELLGKPEQQQSGTNFLFRDRQSG